MGLLMQLLVIAIALAVLLGLSFAEPLSEPPLSLLPQRGSFSPHALTFPRLAPFSEPRGPAISPMELGIAARLQPPLVSSLASPPLLPVSPAKEKIPISPPTISIGTPISPPKKMKPRYPPITAAVTPTPQTLREPPLSSPSNKHPTMPRSPYPSPNNNRWPPVFVSPTPQPARHSCNRKWHSIEVAPTPARSTLRPAPRKWNRSLAPSLSPKPSVQKHLCSRSKIRNKAPTPSFTLHPHPSNPGNVSPSPHLPETHQKGKSRPADPHPSYHNNNYAPAPAPSADPVRAPDHKRNAPFAPYASPPKTAPQGSWGSFAPPVFPLPSPPPNKDCSSFVCMEPFTNTLPGAPCGCVRPVQVILRLNVTLYTFFPLVTKLAEKIAAGIFANQNQVRIMGADAATEQPEKTVVLIDLVPVGAKFDATTALLIYNRLWNKEVVLGEEFGDYDVLYVRYPGLPLPPPTSSSEIPDSTGSPSGNRNNGVTDKPLGVDVSKIPHSRRLDSSAIAIVVLSAALAVILITATAWLVMFRCRHLNAHSNLPPHPLLPSCVRKSDRSKPGSGSMSFASSIAANIGSVKIISYTELQKATGNFEASKIVGEGGFGCVYSGVLENGMHVAVKVRKRDDHQGDQEFMAEVEMLSRLHHRHLVKLIGICVEAHNRCLIYELVPNGSVESHLHGQDKERSPLDWVTRLKIALGAARGLAYLHEDSYPRVIHRDFKSSNILLEDDFTPKVSDFGLARTGKEEKNGYVSTRVMGTFGYVAPEYAMTGHLLVKSDVYSYGVVLLELLTGRKPVDMSQPPGEENLVTWARPQLTSKEGLESVLDKSLRPFMSYDSLAKVAAIASLCVQPEVSRRPYMGEVVQALKLVYDQCGDFTSDINNGNTGSSSHFSIPLNSDHNLNSEFDVDDEIGISVSEPLYVSPNFLSRISFSVRRHSTSGPFTSGRRMHFWRRIKRSF